MFNYPYKGHYEFSQLTQFLQDSGVTSSDIVICGERSPDYYNIPAAFDIETSSLYDRGNKFATMYIWQFGLNGLVIYGRTWAEFGTLLRELTNHFGLHHGKRMIIYVHNLSYEFQFMRKHIKWATDSKHHDIVFSLKKRRPIYALTESGIEFRCSYFLSNCSLAYIGSKMLFKYPVKKLTGDLDYSKIRHSETPLTKQELEYCFNDVRVVMSYIQEKIEQEGDISQIPLTNTGYVRKFTRDYCTGKFIDDPVLSKKQSMNYHAIMKALKIQSEKEYAQLKGAFAGGFTHASPLKSRCGENDDTPYWSNVGSADLSSSYPYTMVSSYFPMSTGRFLGTVKYPEQFSQLIKKYCCLFTCTFYGIYQVFRSESYISLSKCIDISDDYIQQNGRVVEADHLTIHLTELDFDIISNVYDWDYITVTNMRVYDRGYLPKVFIESILELYSAKTSLKGVADKIIEYMIKKGMLNSAYGMCVTDIVRDDAIYFNGSWTSIEADAFSQLTSYNNGFTRFLFYPWGVWVTAHARHNLWDAILEFGDDYIYADTDSIKGINFDKHQKFFDIYNSKVQLKLFLMCDYYNIPKSKVMPKTIKGAKKLIGVWEREENYIKFRTIGAKRYLYQYEDGRLGLTVSGVNKNYALPYLIHKYCGVDYELCKLAYSTDPRDATASKEALSQLISMNIDYTPIFKVFDNTLEIPPGYSGKNIHTYSDKPYFCKVTDYLGKSMYCSELSYTHLEPTGYYFSMSKDYMDYLSGYVTSTVEI